MPGSAPGSLGKYYLEHIFPRGSNAVKAERETQEDEMADGNNPAALANAPTRRQAIVGAAIAIGGLALASTASRADAEGEISHTAESIHQEPVFKASRKRVYDALTDAKQFDKIIQLSGAMQSMRLADKPAEISREVGGAFALFGGYITGRHVELVPDQRIVQAWRAGNWAPGVYSIVKFELVEQGSGTKIVFDHTGFPKGDAESLASGWKAHYWEPLEKLLA
jgi:activator of HSP90 ATPase